MNLLEKKILERLKLCLALGQIGWITSDWKNIEKEHEAQSVALRFAKQNILLFHFESSALDWKMTQKIIGLIPLHSWNI